MTKTRFLLLSEKEEIKIYNYLSSIGSVKWEKGLIDTDITNKFDWIICYGYHHIISNEVIKAVKNPIINLHISFLPFNRGCHPNYWSFKERTPKGVTIHFIDEGIDTGPILIQKKIKFESFDTLNSSYLKLKKEIENLFCENFMRIIGGKIKPKKQIGKGSFHLKSDLPKDVNWNININKI